MDCRVGEGVQAQGTSRGRQKQEGFLEARGIPALSDRRKKEAYSRPLPLGTHCLPQTAVSPQVQK